MPNWTQSNHVPDWPIRAQALLAVERLAISAGGRIPWSEIAKGFSYKGQQIQLASLQGLDGTTLRVPEEPLARPDSAFLELRFDRFEAAQT